jgi:hypothetical protein
MALTDDELAAAIRSVLARNHPGYFGDTIAACVRSVREAEAAAAEKQQP